jgi:hypothetical protein
MANIVSFMIRPNDNQTTIKPLKLIEVIPESRQEIVLQPVLSQWQDFEITNLTDWRLIFLENGYDYKEELIIEEPKNSPYYILENATVASVSRCCGGGKTNQVYKSAYSVYWKIKNIESL